MEKLKLDGTMCVNVLCLLWIDEIKTQARGRQQWGILVRSFPLSNKFKVPVGFQNEGVVKECLRSMVNIR